MEEKVKKKTTFWLPPDMIDRMDGWLKADNCRSRNEFVEKALRFYMGYLSTEDNTAYISQAILTAIQGTLDDNTLTVYIKRLREKIEDDPADPKIILTVRGTGYKVDA